MREWRDADGRAGPERGGTNSDERFLRDNRRINELGCKAKEELHLCEQVLPEAFLFLRKKERKKEKMVRM